MSGAAIRCARGALATLVAAAGALSVPAGGLAAVPRLLVMDLPYARVWDGTLHALGGYPIARASAGVIETARTERPPRADELGVERVAERITVRVDAVAPGVTRISVDVVREGLRGSRWVPLEDDGAAARTIIGRIRAGID